MATFTTRVLAAAAAPIITTAAPDEEGRREIVIAGRAGAADQEAKSGAASSQQVGSGGGTVIFVALIVAGAAVGIGLDQALHATRGPLKLAEGVSVFALFLLAAQLVERVIEPFSGLPILGEKKSKAEEAEQKSVEALNAPTNETKAKEAAKALAEVDKVTQRRKMILWGVATALGTIISGGFGLHFLSMLLAAENPPDRMVDILTTGLLIGGGSQPLHDLIKKIQVSKEKDETPPGGTPGVK